MTDVLVQIWLINAWLYRSYIAHDTPHCWNASYFDTARVRVNNAALFIAENVDK